MKTAKLFKNGRSQAVRLPKEYQFSGTDVFIKKFNNIVMLFPKNDPWAPLINSLDQFSDDFINERNQPVASERDLL
jgi:antitoxin VapB